MHTQYNTYQIAVQTCCQFTAEQYIEVWNGGTYLILLSGGCRCLTGEEVPLRLGLLTCPVSEVDPDSIIPNVFLWRFVPLFFKLLGFIVAVLIYGFVFSVIVKNNDKAQCLWRVD